MRFESTTTNTDFLSKLSTATKRRYLIGVLFIFTGLAIGGYLVRPEMSRKMIAAPSLEVAKKPVGADFGNESSSQVDQPAHTENASSGGRPSGNERPKSRITFSDAQIKDLSRLYAQILGQRDANQLKVDDLLKDRDIADLYHAKKSGLTSTVDVLVLIQSLNDPAFGGVLRAWFNTDPEFYQGMKRRLEASTAASEVNFAAARSPDDLISLLQQSETSFQNRYEVLRDKLQVNPEWTTLIEGTAGLDYYASVIRNCMERNGYFFEPKWQTFSPAEN